MRFSSWESERFQISSGLPQGSPLSCVLFNIHAADVIGWTHDDKTDPYSYVNQSRPFHTDLRRPTSDTGDASRIRR